MAKAKSSKTGKRYGKKQKANILKSIADFNREHGRGGSTFAHKKYKVALQTLMNWQKKSAPKASKKVARKPRRKIGKKSRRVGNGSFRTALNLRIQNLEKLQIQKVSLEKENRRRKDRHSKSGPKILKGGIFPDSLQKRSK